MRFSVFDEEGTLLATNEYYSVGGGFVVNEQTQGERDQAFLFARSNVDLFSVSSRREPLLPLRLEILRRPRPS